MFSLLPTTHLPATHLGMARRGVFTHHLSWRQAPVLQDIWACAHPTSRPSPHHLPASHSHTRTCAPTTAFLTYTHTRHFTPHCSWIAHILLSTHFAVGLRTHLSRLRYGSLFPCSAHRRWTGATFAFSGIPRLHCCAALPLTMTYQRLYFHDWQPRTLPCAAVYPTAASVLPVLPAAAIHHHHARLRSLLLRGTHATHRSHAHTMYATRLPHPTYIFLPMIATIA